MYHWPLTFSLMGFTSVLFMVTLFLLYRMIRSQLVSAGESGHSRGVTSPSTPDQYGDLSDSSDSEDEAEAEEEGVEEVQSRDARTEGEDGDETTLRRRTVSPSGDEDVKESVSSSRTNCTIERLMEF